MKVCLVNPTRLIKRPVSELAAELTERGHDVGILTPAGESGLHHESYLDEITIHEYEAWEPPLSQEWPIPNPGLSKLIRGLNDEYDVLHSWTHFYLSSLLLAWNQPETHVVTLDTVPGESFSTGWFLDKAFYLYNRTIGQWVLNQANQVTVYSDELISHLRNTGYDNDIKVTPTGVKPPEITQDPGLPDDYVAFIGLITERKGIDRLLKIAQRLPDTTFLVAGDSPERKKWEEKAPGNVEFLGKIDYVPALLEQARCLLLPSRGEGLPGVVMEAMAMRCPVVASDIPCIPDLIPDKNHGFLVDQDSIDAYIDAIQTVHDNKTREKTVENAYERITTRFSWDNATDRFLDAYA